MSKGHKLLLITGFFLTISGPCCASFGNSSVLTPIGFFEFLSGQVFCIAGIIGYWANGD